ncbi:MAG: hypothetical protein V1793_14420 [Pseudomonadota bacterium]
MPDFLRENAKAIPRSTLALITALAAGIIMLEPCRDAGGTEPSTYYIQLDVRYSQSAVDRSNLLMIPGEAEFRSENFTRMLISGSASSLPGSPAKDMETLAKQNALKTLLEEHGLTSVKTATHSVNNSSHSTTVMSYQGAVKLPFTMIRSGYDTGREQYVVTMEVLFAPTAFPDQWRHLEMKHRAKQWVDHVMSWFTRNPD